jgi:CO dehydrogenase maturation factor
MLKQVISHLIIRREDVVIMDMEAGLEHLGRGTADIMDQFIVVVEPGERSIQTYHKVVSLAADLGIRKVRVIANKIRTRADEEFITAKVPESDHLGFIHFDDDVTAADRAGRSPYDISEKTVAEIRAIKQRVDNE